jgi:type II secretory pathway pseudopilin PulG
MRAACACAVVVVLAALAGSTASARVADDRETDAMQVSGYLRDALDDLRLGLGDLKSRKVDFAAANQEVKRADQLTIEDIRPLIDRVLSHDPQWMGVDPAWSTLKTDAQTAPISLRSGAGQVDHDKQSIGAVIRKVMAMLGIADQLEHPPCKVTTTVTPGSGTTPTDIHLSFLCDENVKTLEIDTESEPVAKCVNPGSTCEVQQGHEIIDKQPGGDPILDLILNSVTYAPSPVPGVIEIVGDSGDKTFVDDPL